MTQTLQEIGWREWLALPELGIDMIKAKVDTGARTSALHAFEVQPSADGSTVRFAMHPKQRETDTVIWCESAVVDRRLVRDSGGHEEERFVIGTNILLGSACYAVEVTLTDRDSMGFRMLLGRTALSGRYLVNSARSYCLSEPPK